MSEGMDAIRSAGTSIRAYRDEPDEELSDARIGSQLAFMGEQINQANAMLSELQQTIDPVLLPSLPGPTAMDDNIKSPGPKPTSEISGRIDDLNSELSRLQQRILHLTKRVQL